MNFDKSDMDDLDFLPFEDWKEVNQNQLSQIATPDRIPQPPTIRHLPKDVVQTQSVQSLLNHVDELQTRLAVSLKQIANLEGQIAVIQNQQNLDHSERTTFLAQKEVLKEKETLYKDIIRKLELQLSEAEDELEESRQLFSDLHQRYERYKKQFLSLQNEMTESETLTKKQKQRIQLKVRSTFKKYYQAKKQLVDESLRLTALLRKKESQTEQMRLNLSLTVEQLQNKESEFRENEKTLTLYFEAEIGQLTSDRDRLIRENEVLKKKSIRLEDLILSHSELENKLVLSQRKMEQLQKQNQDEIEQIQNQMMAYRREAKTLFIEKSAISEELAKAQFENSSQKKEIETLKDRLESFELLLKSKNQDATSVSDSSLSTTEAS